jgi:hypothetical protein
MEPKTIKIDDVEYVRADSLPNNAPAAPMDGKPFVIIRSYGAGVFAGYLAAQTDTLAGKQVRLDRCIRLHRWTGCSLSQVAIDGTAGSGECRFAMPTDNHEVMNVIEIIPCTERARIAIQAVPTWKL